MKKILALLMIFSSIAITHPLKAKHGNNNNYDIKEAARKFRKKHANDNHPTHIPNEISKDGIIAVGHTYITSRKSTIDSIEHFGFFYHRQLTTAIRENDLPLVKLLLQHGANPNKTIELASPVVDGSTVKEFAFTHFHPIEFVSSVKMAQYLEENGADLSPLFKNLDSPVVQKNPELQAYLQKKEAELNN